MQLFASKFSLGVSRLSWIELTLLFAIVTGVRCLRDARLEVLPAVVQRGHEAILRCHYVREDTPLYSLKWYRGKHEFYRFSPNQTPTTKTFPVPGIDVDIKKSNESQVTIRNVDFEITGNFSCEVTADAPTFSTESAWKKLVVVALPEGRPVIVSERDRYDPGDTLKANCTAPPSRPPAVLSFTLNNQPVGQPRVKQLPQRQQKSNRNGNEGLGGTVSYNAKQQEEMYDGPQWNELSLTLQPFHYVNGQLNLRCIVQIAEIYNVTSEIQLSAGLREPVPERVTSENAAVTSNLASLTMLCLAAVYSLLR